MSPNQSQQISASLRKVLNSHGHGFHYAVVRRAEELLTSQQSTWVFEGVEFPVTTGGYVTHVDFILRSRSGRTLMIAECKRADPSKALWCFAKAPYTWRNANPGELAFDELEVHANKQMVRRAHFAYAQQTAFQLGFELRTGQPGDGLGQSRAISEAITQVLRGKTGSINHLCESVRTADHGSLRIESSKRIRFIPVIFTTAQIWVTDVDLRGADLSTGDLANEVQAQAADWIWFTHNQTSNLRPEFYWQQERSALDGFSYDLRREFARSIAIVSPSGLDDFLCFDFEEWL
jgi:hypothetical protein